jgi:Rrf2 family protein
MAMLELALNFGRGPVPGLTIARRQGISLLYLEQLFNKLKKKGLVITVRGPHGGYMLAKEPKDLKVGEILETLDGTLAPVFCVEDKSTEAKCKRAESCVPRVVWKEVGDNVRRVLDSTSLADLCNMEKRLQNAKQNTEDLKKEGQKWCRNLTARR